MSLLLLYNQGSEVVVVPDSAQSGVSRLRRSRKSWADTHLYDVTEVPSPVTLPGLDTEKVVTYQEPEPAVTAVSVTIPEIDEFDPIEIDNDLLMLIAQLAA